MNDLFKRILKKVVLKTLTHYRRFFDRDYNRGPSVTSLHYLTTRSKLSVSEVTVTERG
jgi:hypothetical protein